MTGTASCPKCGTERRDDGFCPRCLIGLGFVESVELTETHDGRTSQEPRRTIGPYNLLRKIGEGGMGEVYLAEQEQPIRRRVALKLIKLGMDTDQVVARFESERQALALMDHPSVAKVFDAGTTPRGRPYFVMEYVKGVPITEHCDRRRLSNRKRLELFREVCEGVQHAHQKAIIHRDLKPSNVLVTDQDGKRLPKIIDFGVAKATAQSLTERTLFTELGVLIGTPEYMSPEQAELTGENVDTRTDVYSLGVMLYELLVGALPFDSKELRVAGFDGIRKKICDEEPPKPSTRLSMLGGKSEESARARKVDLPTLQRQLRGDLDWITMRALEKDRSRRYGSPNELAADIGRYLADEPVLASPPSVTYRARKFAARNRTLVAGVAATMLMLVAGIVSSTIFGLRAETARRVAELEARRAEASQLVTLGNVELEGDRTKALAFALASLERVDTPAGRRLALEALWRGPIATLLPDPANVWGLDFSPDGRWLAGGQTGTRILLWSEDGGMVAELQLSDQDNEIIKTVRFAPDSSRLFGTGYHEPTLKSWSVPNARLLRSIDIEVPAPEGAASAQRRSSWLPPLLDVAIERMVSVSLVRESSSILFQFWAIEEDGPRLLGHREVGGMTPHLWAAAAALDPSGRLLAYGKGLEVFLVDIANAERRPDRLVGRHDAPLARLAFHPSGQTIASIDQQGEIRLWSLGSRDETPARSIQSVELCIDLRFDGDGGRLAAMSIAGVAHLWDLRASPAADPLVFRGIGQGQMNAVAFHPGGQWIATSGSANAAVWPLGRSYPRVLRGHTQPVQGVTFGPRGDWLASTAYDGTIRIWPLDASSTERRRIAYEGEGFWEVRVSPDGARMLATSSTEDPLVISIAGGEARVLTGFSDGPKKAAAFGPRGRLAAVGGGWGDHEPDARIRVWDLQSDQVRVLDPGDGKMISEIAFTPDGGLVSASHGHLRLWNLTDGTFRLRRESAVSQFALSRDGRLLLGNHRGKATVHDLEGEDVRELSSHGNRVLAVALDPGGEFVVTGSGDGVVRVGPVTEDEPYLMFGHEGSVHDVAVSPDGRWIASAGADATVRLWPVRQADLVHSLPHDEFLNLLRAQTNFRVVKDEHAGAGYVVKLSAFPGWKKRPTW